MEWSEETQTFIGELIGLMEELPKPVIRNESQPIGPEDLEIGRFYIAHQKNGSLMIVCVSAAYIDEYGNWMVWMVDYPMTRGVVVDLAEVGVVPYRDGTYNHCCWLEATQNIYSKEVVSGIRKGMFWES